MDGHTLHAFDATSGEPLWGPKPMGHNNQPPVDGTTVFTSGMGNTLRPRNIRSGTETGPRVNRCAAAQAVCDRGTLYVPDLQGSLHAYDTDSGRHLWNWRPEPTAPGFLEAPCVVDDSVFVAWTESGSSQPWALQALHADTGYPRWPEPLRLPSPEHWMVSDDKLFAITSGVGTGAPWLAMHDVYSGTLLWQKQLSDRVVGKPMASEKSLHLAHSDGHVSSFDALTGENRWTVKVAKSLRTHPVATGEQVLITSWDPGRLFALDNTQGTIAWQGRPRRAASLMTPAYLTDSSAWAVSRAGVLQGWSLDTRRRLPGECEDLPWNPADQGIPQVWDGVLYVVTGNGNLQAIRLDDTV
ncbi:outer membrane protein assembly factor BamB family protein [Streptomyces physcomitrii]|uniref:PQQ-binding-like beta-propeller repeat protein n=1 Tax=Streptomyces physcomitrii TaxID=2724184 RepID=A0ABX1H2F4_9ACTN|nr:PQQ-binding-like beta-propeller repeat protein [Streptomyces physcomitrii]NKI41520.1 PQQ-binding-like beta-propeller repeat protein [Streptomyces physcomitrii]